MKKAALKVAISYLILTGLIFSPGLIFSYQNDPDGFRDIKWETPKSQIKGLRLNKKNGGLSEYIKEKENLDFSGIKITQILYGFVGDKLIYVTLQFNPSSEAKYHLLNAILIAKFGEGERLGAREIFWKGEKTNIKLNFDEKGAQIFFSDSRDFLKPPKEISEFNSALQKYWGELLKDNDVRPAIKKLQLWLAKGKNSQIESYYISPYGKQIVINFKDGQSQVFYPSPLSVNQEPESSKIYSVSEALNVLRLKPERFKGKDVFLKACTVNAVMGSGCEDFFVLTDPEYIEGYLKHEKNIPTLNSGPTMNMPQEIFPTRCAAYRGHFFDPGLKPCQNGSLRFVITTKIKEME